MTTAPARNPDELCAGLQGRIRRPSLPVAYQLGLLVVSVAMIVLPLLYLALVVASGWAVLWWAVHGLELLAQGSAGSIRIRLFVYLVPLFAGGAVPFFLLKPFFSRVRFVSAAVELDRREQPRVFAFVERLAAVVGAPVPDRITVDTRVNASAGLELGLLRREGSALVLNIGLPLVAAMTVPQLGGVLAHEFGHFAQGLGIRLSRVIRGVNRWFDRVVNERDRWDDSLQEGVDEGGWTGIAYFVAKAMVALGRKVLWVLMVAGHAVSCFLTRQMEFDADQYEARVAGSSAFADVFMRLRVLDAAGRFALESLLGDGRFVDDIPGLIAGVADHAPPRLMTSIRMAIQRSGTGLFDTHPSDLERLRRARAGRFPGLLTGQSPAAALFRDFPAVCRRATLAFYDHALGPHAPGEDALLPVAAFVAPPPPPEAKPAAGKLEFPPERPPRLRAHVVIRSGGRADFDAARERWRAAGPAAVAALEKCSRAWAQLVDATTAEAFLSAGLRLRPQEFSLPEATPAGVERTRSRALGMQSEANRDVEPAERALAERIGLAVGRLSAGLPTLPDAVALHDEARRLLPALAAFETAQEPAARLRCASRVVDCMLGNQQNLLGHQALDEEIHRRLPDLRRDLDTTRTALTDIALPGPAWDIPPPWRDDPVSFVRSAMRALEALDDQHARVVARLVQIAAAVEAALEPPP